jgi:hypothetical protein
VQKCYSKLKQLETDLFFQKRQLEHVLGDNVFEDMERYNKYIQTKTTDDTKRRQVKKFDALFTKQMNLRQPCDRQVVNLSSKKLNTSQISVLSRGLNFAPAPKSVPTAHFIANIEAGIKKAGLEEKVAEKARMNVIGAISRAKMPPRNILPLEYKALRDLARDEEILVLPADKGKATVIMDKTDYDAKMNEMLQDEQTYRPIAKDPTPSLEKRMNSKLLELKKAQRLPDDIYSRLRSSAGRTPLFYGLPKIHKDNVPLRPIVSFVSSPTYQLSKYLSNLLYPLVGMTDSHVSNSKDFVDFVSTQTLADDERMVSFDVVSLFTRVPTNLAVQVARCRLRDDDTLVLRTGLRIDDITDLLTMCLNATYLQFRGKIYQQIHGTAMGSPVSVAVANLVMEHVEQKALGTYHHPPRAWKRYVDDTWAILQKDLVEEFLYHLNTIESTIQFTSEEESDDGMISFLDVCLRRDTDGSINTSVYRKPTSTNQYLHFQSHHPTGHKVSVVRTLMNRAATLSSTPSERTREEKKITEALKANGYTAAFIRRHAKATVESETVDNRTPKVFVTLPYIKGLSECVRRILTPLDIQVAFRPHYTIRNTLVHPKDKTPTEQRSGIVYKISCSECPKVYIGQTGRSLKQRITEHRRAIRNGDLATSALAEHAWNTGHHFDTAAAEIIDAHPHVTTRCLLESWHIQKDDNTINREKGTPPREHTPSPG